MQKLAVLLLCVMLQPVWVVGQQKGKLGESLDNLITDFSKEGYSGSVLIAQNGEIILRKGYGLAVR